VHHWIELKLVGVRSNRDAVGARVRLQTARGWQTRVVSAGSASLSAWSLVQHFGLGDDATARGVENRVAWGEKTVVGDLAADGRYVIAESAAARCPPVGPARRRPGRPEVTSLTDRAVTPSWYHVCIGAPCAFT